MRNDEQFRRNRRTVLAATALGCLAASGVFSTSAFAYVRESAEENPGNSPVWQDIRKGAFGNRPIVEDKTGEVIDFTAPKRAEDAAIVPIAITAKLPQSPSRYIKRIYLIIDENPSPSAAVFDLTPDSGLASIETRVRIEDYTFVRVIAELNDGKLYSSTHFVKASGGCSAAAEKDEAAALANIGKIRLRVEGQSVVGKPTLAQLMINHPNRSGLVMNQITRLYTPAYFVRNVAVTYAGKPILTAHVNFSISENPNFRFYFVPRGAGKLTAVVEDTKDLKFESQVAVTPQS